MKDFDARKMLYDLVGPVVGRGLTGPYEGLNVPRLPTDYNGGRQYLLPPNFFRPLISDVALTNLREGMEKVRNRHGKRFGLLDIHMRAVYPRGRNRDKMLPSDVLTYIEFDGRMCYTPVNVSILHKIVGDPNIDFSTKREMVEKHIFQMTHYPFPGLDVSVYGVSFPERFSYGLTDQLFNEYPSFAKDRDDWRDDLKVEKRYLDLGGELGVYAIYFFKGSNIPRDEFLRIIDDPAFILYNAEIATRWNKNFESLIKQTTNDEPIIITGKTILDYMVDIIS